MNTEQLTWLGCGGLQTLESSLSFSLQLARYIQNLTIAKEENWALV
jgi:hypothetical protein